MSQYQPTDHALAVLGQETLSIILRAPSLQNPTSWMLLDHWALSYSDLLREKGAHPTALALYLNDKTEEVREALINPQALEMQRNGLSKFEVLQMLGISIDLPSDL